MKKETFHEIVQVVHPALEKRDTHLRRAIPTEKRVGVAIGRLATGDTSRSIAKTFAIGKSTTVKITKEFCLEMKRKASHYIKFPKTRLETSECIEKFRISTNCKIPQVVVTVNGTHVRQVVGAVDGTHVRTALPKQMENQIILVANSAILLLHKLLSVLTSYF